jgi:hypothetical protein
MRVWRRRPANGSVALLDHEPQTPLDSLLRDFLCRIVESQRTITINLDKPVKGHVRWAAAATPSGSRQVTLWFEPAEAQAVSDDGSRIAAANGGGGTDA